MIKLYVYRPDMAVSNRESTNFNTSLSAHEITGFKLLVRMAWMY
jgi:hypothetical protein